tara:strand:+ start:353 stop:724 length:372 start_codon:yes stop_codon:yes gene_type:complete
MNNKRKITFSDKNETFYIDKDINRKRIISDKQLLENMRYVYGLKSKYGRKWLDKMLDYDNNRINKQVLLKDQNLILTYHYMLENENVYSIIDQYNCDYANLLCWNKTLLFEPKKWYIVKREKL